MPALWTGLRNYMIHVNDDLFNLSMPGNRPQKLISSCYMGFMEDLEEFRAHATTDINQANTSSNKIIFEFKSFQTWYLDHQIMLLNSPTKAPMSSITEKFGSIFSNLESSLVQKYPNKYSTWKHSWSLLQFEIILD